LKTIFTISLLSLDGPGKIILDVGGGFSFVDGTDSLTVEGRVRFSLGEGPSNSNLEVGGTGTGRTAIEGFSFVNGSGAITGEKGSCLCLVNGTGRTAIEGLTLVDGPGSAN
jgi:hypothetical protein